MPFPYSQKLHQSPLTIPSLLLLLLSFLLLILLYSQTTPNHSQSTPSLYLSLSSTSNLTISSHLHSLTLHSHLAGTPSSASAATYVLTHLRLSGLQTLTQNYTPLLSYPSTSSLSLLNPNLTLIKKLSLSEPADPTASVVPPYHAYSPSGSAVAPAVYVSYGREEDYLALDRIGVDVRGRVVIARRGKGPRGSVVERAAEKGAVAVLMFGERAGEGVERGTVMIGGVGDPLTPGWAVVDGGGERLGVEDGEVRRRFPKIPSMPVSVATAAEIMRTVGRDRVPDDWIGGLQLEDGGVGGGPALVNFTYQVTRDGARD